MTYEPALDYVGTDQFTYTISDDSGGTDTATVSLDVISLPELVINDVTVEEGDSGTTYLIFQVDLIGTPTKPVTVDYETKDGTATAVNDYEQTDGRLSWSTGDSSPRFVIVRISADTNVESDEYFSLVLENPTNVILRSDIAYGYIENDDVLAGAEAIFEFALVELAAEVDSPELSSSFPNARFIEPSDSPSGELLLRSDSESGNSLWWRVDRISGEAQLITETPRSDAAWGLFQDSLIVTSYERNQVYSVPLDGTV